VQEAKSQIASPYSSRDLSVYTDGQTDLFKSNHSLKTYNQKILNNLQVLDCTTHAANRLGFLGFLRRLIQQGATPTLTIITLKPV